MKTNKEIKSKADVIARAADFVIENSSDTKFEEVYILEPEVLGEGAFGRVQKCTRIGTTEKRAVKIIEKNTMQEAEKVRLKYEIDILKNLNHPCIVRLYEVFEDKINLFLVTELCDGKELFDEIVQRKKFSELEAAIVTKQVLQAMAYCHEKNVAHRDLKPENILIDSKQRGHIKVIDFGTSHVFDKENPEMKQMYGTAYYIAPEVLEGKYTAKCDMWSIGVILYIMLSGRPPFSGNNDHEILRKVAQANYSLNDTVWQKRSPDVLDLIKKLMEKNPEKRLSAQEALQHEWIQRKVHNEFDVDAGMEALEELKHFRVSSNL